MPPKAKDAAAKHEKQVIRPLLGTLQYTLDKYSSSDSKTPDTPDQLKILIEQLEKPIQQLIKAQASDDSKIHTPDDKSFASLEAWLAKEAPLCYHGSRFRLSQSSEKSEGWGVVAARDLQDGEQFINIPRRVIMSTDTALSSPVGAILKNDTMCLRMPSLFLAVHLLYEDQNADSFWRPYLSCLPRSFALPLFNTSPSSLSSWLQSSALLYDVWALQRSTLRQYLHLYGVLQKAGWLNTHSFTFESFRWAVAIVMTRQNRIPATAADRVKSPDQTVIALIPGWDFCNHRGYGKIATYFDVESDCSVSCTIEKVPAGSPIYLYYGSRPNSKLYMFQGFVDAQHTSDYVAISFELEKDDPLFKLRTLLLSKMQTGFSYEGHLVYAALPLPIELSCKPSTQLKRKEDESDEAYQTRIRQFTQQQQHLLTFLRIAVLTKEEATNVLKNPKVGFISLRNELAAMDFLHSQLTSHLTSYGTTMDEDTKLLTDTSRSSAEHVAIQYRLSEKRLIVDGLDTVQKWKVEIAQEHDIATTSDEVANVTI